MPAVLVLLSGGLDSSFLLHHCLAHPDWQGWQVHAHHVSIRIPGVTRWQSEGAAVRRVVEHLRATARPFAYSESAFALSIGGDVGWDSDLQLLAASKVVPGIRAERVAVALGWCAADLARPAIAERSVRNVTPNLWRALRASMNQRNHVDEDVTMPLVAMGLTKAQMLQQLPRALAQAVWSCRGHGQAGAEARPCGQCHACAMNRQAIDEAGLAPADFPNLVAV